VSKLNFSLALILGAFVAVVLASVLATTAFAQGEDADDVAAAKKMNRRYPGGQDEQALTVQNSLPLPTRYPDAPRPTPTQAGAEAASHD
jgi:hypothetical protein